MNVTAAELAGLPEGAFAAFRDWVSGLKFGEVAEKYGYEDRAAAYKIVRQVQYMTLLNPPTGWTVIPPTRGQEGGCE